MKRLLLAALAISAGLNTNTFAADMLPGGDDDRGGEKRSGDDEGRARKNKRARKEIAKDPVQVAEELRAQQAADLELAFLNALRTRITARLDAVVTRSLRARGVDVAAWLDAKIAEAHAAFQAQQEAQEAAALAAHGALVIVNAGQQAAAIQQSLVAGVENADAIIDQLAAHENVAHVEDQIAAAGDDAAEEEVVVEQQAKSVAVPVAGVEETPAEMRARLEADLARALEDRNAATARLQAVQSRSIFAGLYDGLAAAFAGVRGFLGGFGFGFGGKR